MVTQERGGWCSAIHDTHFSLLVATLAKLSQVLSTLGFLPWQVAKVHHRMRHSVASVHFVATLRLYQNERRFNA